VNLWVAVQISLLRQTSWFFSLFGDSYAEFGLTVSLLLSVRWQLAKLGLCLCVDMALNFLLILCHKLNCTNLFHVGAIPAL